MIPSTHPEARLKLHASLSLILISAAAFGQSVDGPSFDCRRARGIDKMICSDPQLAALDRQLAELVALASEQAPGEIKRNQRPWLRERNACKEPTCVKNSYERRIDELVTLTGKFPASIVQSLCALMESPEQRAETLAQKAGAEDLNNDGIPDVACEAAPCALSIDSAIPTAPVERQAPESDSTTPRGRAAFRYGNRTFIYASSDAALEMPLRISYITPTNREVRLCELETIVGSAVVEGGHDVCAAVENNAGFESIELQRIDLPSSSAFGRPNTRVTGSGTIDVDNDGLDEPIVELRYDSGESCTINYFEMLAEDGTSIVENSKSIPLRELQRPALNSIGRTDCGRIANRFLRFAGKNYYETNVTNEPSVPHEIRVLEGTADATVCTLERQIRTRIKQLHAE